MVSGCVYWALSAAPGVLVPFMVPAPEPGPDSLMVVQASEVRVIGDIRGVTLRPEAGGQAIEFSEVSEVRWTSSALIITGTTDALGSTDPDGVITACYPLADIHSVIVREYGEGSSSLSSFLGPLPIGFVSGLLGLWLAFSLE